MEFGWGAGCLLLRAASVFGIVRCKGFYRDCDPDCTPKITLFQLGKHPGDQGLEELPLEWGEHLVVVGEWSLSSLMAAVTWEARLLLCPPLAGIWRQCTGKRKRRLQQSSLFSDMMSLRMVVSLLMEDSCDPHRILRRSLGLGRMEARA